MELFSFTLSMGDCTSRLHILEPGEFFPRRWAERAGVGRVAIPTGQVSSEELCQVVLTLACARTEREGAK